jgi:hypothetical protein
MSHGTMKYTLKAHVCYFVLMRGSFTICTHSMQIFTLQKKIINIETLLPLFRTRGIVHFFYKSPEKNT